jgi:hypothetical protein
MINELGRIAKAERLSVEQLKQELQDKSLPAYIAIPLIQEKMEMKQRMQNTAAMQQQQQPPIAEQVMQEARRPPMLQRPQMPQMPQRQQMAAGIPDLQTNLPAQMAGGGIVAFGDGGGVERYQNKGLVSGMGGMFGNRKYWIDPTTGRITDGTRFYDSAYDKKNLARLQNEREAADALAQQSDYVPPGVDPEGRLVSQLTGGRKPYRDAESMEGVPSWASVETISTGKDNPYPNVLIPRSDSTANQLVPGGSNQNLSQDELDKASASFAGNTTTMGTPSDAELDAASASVAPYVYGAAKTAGAPTSGAGITTLSRTQPVNQGIAASPMGNIEDYKRIYGRSNADTAEAGRLLADVRGINEQEERAYKEREAAYAKAMQELGERGVKQEETLKKREKELEGQKDVNFNLALIRAGAAMMGGTSQYALQNIGIGVGVGAETYEKGLDKIQKRREALDESFARLEDARYSDKKVAAKELHDREKDFADKKANAARALVSLNADLGLKYDRETSKAAVDAYLKDQTENRKMANALQVARIGHAKEQSIIALQEEAYRISKMPPGPEKDAALAQHNERLGMVQKISESTSPYAGIKGEQTQINAIREMVGKDQTVQAIRDRIKNLPPNSRKMADAMQDLQKAEKEAYEKLKKQFPTLTRELPEINFGSGVTAPPPPPGFIPVQ